MTLSVDIIVKYFNNLVFKFHYKVSHYKVSFYKERLKFIDVAFSSSWCFFLNYSSFMSIIVFWLTDLFGICFVVEISIQSHKIKNPSNNMLLKTNMQRQCGPVAHALWYEQASMPTTQFRNVKRRSQGDLSLLIVVQKKWVNCDKNNKFIALRKGRRNIQQACRLVFGNKGRNKTRWDGTD